MNQLFEWVPDGKLTCEEAKQLLAPFCFQLRTVWCEAWKSWNAEVTDVGRSQLTTRSRSSCVNDFAVERAKDVFAGVDCVRPCQFLGFFKLYVADRAVLRLKRLNRDRLAMNVKTDQQIAYYLDEPIAGILPNCTRLTVGYMLNVAETEIEDILVTYQLGRRSLRWSFSILDDAAPLALPTVSPIGPSPVPIPIQPKVARSKDGASA